MVKGRHSKTGKSSGKMDVRRVFSLFGQEIFERLLPEEPRYAAFCRYLSAQKPKGHYLDLGCGIGVLPILAAGLGFDPIGLDDFNDPIYRTFPFEKIREINLDHGSDIAPWDLNSGVLDFPDGAFSFVSMTGVIEHLHHSPRKILEEIRRVLAPHGRFMVETVNAVSLRKRLSVLRGRLELFFTGGILPERTFQRPCTGVYSRRADYGITPRRILDRNRHLPQFSSL